MRIRSDRIRILIQNFKIVLIRIEIPQIGMTLSYKKCKNVFDYYIIYNYVKC